MIIIIILFIIILLYLLNKNKYNKKIAFIFLIYDEINHEDLWKLFFNNIDPNKYNIYIHYKYYKKSNFFDKYKLKTIIPTAYGDISLVKAHNILLREALKDINNTNFILLSNSCIPLKNFNYIYEKLNPNYSYYNMASETNYFRNTQAFNYIDTIYFKKASQWSILNRSHANILVNDENKYINWFINCPDEHSHISYLYYKKLDNEIIKTYDANYDATTYIMWINDNLINYDNINNNELLLLYNSKCFFGRKFTKNCKNLDLLNNLIISNI
jgi:hypothetical protein